MTRFRAGFVVLCALAGLAAAQWTASPASGDLFRVFLKSGEALPSYGEAAVVGDRVVFTLVVGGGDGSALQLVSLPAGSVDLDRTAGYTMALRAAHYAATRGEVDFAAMTQEVQRTLAELRSVADPKRRLELAESARRRLQAWAEGTYGYRAADVRELTDLFDEVIASLQAATGAREFSIDLRASPAPSHERLLPTPSAGESIRLALVAAGAADSEDDRLAVLRAASTAAEAAADPELKALVAREVDFEAKATAAYTQLASEARARAEAARRRGDVAGVSAAISTVRSRDRELGARRPGLTAALLAELEATLERVRAYREALDHYTVVRPTLLAYERAVRPVMSGFDGLAPVFGAVRDERYTAYERLVRAGTRLANYAEAMQATEPPPDVADVHASLLSAIRMAAHAIDRRRLAVSAGSREVAAEASSAAAGAMLLAAQAREVLVSRLYPPKIQ